MAAKSATSLAVVILAAGASSRMGRPKLLLPWGATSVVGHLINQWQKLDADQIAIVCREGDTALNDELDWLGFPVENRIVNEAPERGMFGSVLCAARWAGWRRDLAAWALVLGDQPHLKLSTLETLIAFYRNHPHSICQPACEGHGGHPVILPRDAFLSLSQSGAESLKHFLKTGLHPLNKCLIDDPGLGLDLDSPQDYQRATGQSLIESRERIHSSR